jgi:hypothetical protein
VHQNIITYLARGAAWGRRSLPGDSGGGEDALQIIHWRGLKTEVGATSIDGWISILDKGIYFALNSSSTANSSLKLPRSNSFSFVLFFFACSADTCAHEKCFVRQLSLCHNSVDEGKVRAVFYPLTGQSSLAWVYNILPTDVPIEMPKVHVCEISINYTRTTKRHLTKLTNESY